MIYGHDFLPASDIRVPGPPVTSVTELTPTKLKEWSEGKDESGVTPQQIATERRARAWGFGSLRWDPNSSRGMAPGWIRHYPERQDTTVVH
jgi:hypothetical protein